MQIFSFRSHFFLCSISFFNCVLLKTTFQESFSLWTMWFSLILVDIWRLAPTGAAGLYAMPFPRSTLISPSLALNWNLSTPFINSGGKKNPFTCFLPSPKLHEFPLRTLRALIYSPPPGSGLHRIFCGPRGYPHLFCPLLQFILSTVGFII